MHEVRLLNNSDYMRYNGMKWNMILGKQNDIVYENLI